MATCRKVFVSLTFHAIDSIPIPCLQAYNWADRYRNQTVWLPPAPRGAVGTGNSVPWLGVAEFLGINTDEAAEHLALGMWTHTHPNSVPDPKVGLNLHCNVNMIMTFIMVCREA